MLGDKGYTGASIGVHVPFKHHPDGPLHTDNRCYNRLITHYAHPPNGAMPCSAAGGPSTGSPSAHSASAQLLQLHWCSPHSTAEPGEKTSLQDGLPSLTRCHPVMR